MGIADSKGVTYDFGGPYYIACDNFSFGSVTRYMQYNPKDMVIEEDLVAAEVWDEAIVDSNTKYKSLMHNICCQNCHHHTACAFGKMRQKHVVVGDDHCSMVRLGAEMFFFGQFTSIAAFIWSVGPFMCIVSLIVYSYS
jgi:hypothetical protein